ncbi:MAG: hypothetical protein H6923_00175 [Alphaproteobacteria bacterium]|nr:hypothetical protein [Alphaproteobacteria bacterium]
MWALVVLAEVLTLGVAVAIPARVAWTLEEARIRECSRSLTTKSLGTEAYVGKGKALVEAFAEYVFPGYMTDNCYGHSISRHKSGSLGIERQIRMASFNGIGRNVAKPQVLMTFAGDKFNRNFVAMAPEEIHVVQGSDTGYLDVFGRALPGISYSQGKYYIFRFQTNRYVTGFDRKICPNLGLPDFLNFRRGLPRFVEHCPGGNKSVEDKYDSEYTYQYTAAGSQENRKSPFSHVLLGVQVIFGIIGIVAGIWFRNDAMKCVVAGDGSALDLYLLASAWGCVVCGGALTFFSVFVLIST